MNGASAVAEAKATRAAMTSSMTTSGIIHHSFCDHRNPSSSPAIPNRAPRSRTVPASPHSPFADHHLYPRRRSAATIGQPRRSMGQRSIARPKLGGAYHHPMRIALNAQKLSFAQAYHAAGISRYIYHLLHELRE